LRQTTGRRWLAAVLFIALYPLAPGQSAPITLRSFSGHPPARSTWSMKAADHAGSLKRMRQNLRIGHIFKNRAVVPMENKPPLGSIYRQTGMTQR
jgi:hypothetical protein